MSILGAVGGGGSYWPWFGLIPSVMGDETVYGSLLSSVSKSPWLSVSEKERIEQLLLSGSLVIPPPQINIAIFQNIALNFPDFFSITLVKAIGGLGVFGIVECAVTLAALSAWAKSQHYSDSDLIKILEKTGSTNPFEAVLKDFIEHGEIKGVDALTLQTLLRQLAVLQAALKTVSPKTVLEAFLLAQQQLVIALLQKWSESLGRLAELQKEAMKKQELQNAERAREILSTYIKNALITQEGLKQPVVSMLLGALFMDAAMMTTISALLPAFSVGGVVRIPGGLGATLSVLAGGIIASTLMWAAPIAMAITTHPPGLSESQVLKDSASAFALALASMVNNPEFDALLHNSLAQAVANGEITQSKAETISATFKASMLMVAMALLYKSNMGGVSGSELRAIITGEIHLAEGDFLSVLAKLVNEQLGKVDATEREKLLDELVSPFNSSVSLEELLSPLTCFISGWNPRCIRESSLANHG